MIEFFNYILDFTRALFNMLNLFFELFFNRLNIFGLGVGWWSLIFIIISTIVYSIIGGLNDD